MNGPQDLGILAAVVALCMGLVETVKRLASKPKSAGAGYTAQDRERDNFLADQHRRYDRDGNELWYFPRSIGETLEEILSEIREMRKLIP